MCSHAASEAGRRKPAFDAFKKWHSGSRPWLRQQLPARQGWSWTLELPRLGDAGLPGARGGARGQISNLSAYLY